LAAFSVLGVVLFVALGIRCLASHDLFDCIGLLTIFPAAFAVVAMASAAVGFRRFTTLDTPPQHSRAQIGFGPARATLDEQAHAERRRPQQAGDVIALPGRMGAPPDGSVDGPAESGDKGDSRA